MKIKVGNLEFVAGYAKVFEVYAISLSYLSIWTIGWDSLLGYKGLKTYNKESHRYIRS